MQLHLGIPNRDGVKLDINPPHTQYLTMFVTDYHVNPLISSGSRYISSMTTAPGYVCHKNGTVMYTGIEDDVVEGHLIKLTPIDYLIFTTENTTTIVGALKILLSNSRLVIALMSIAE